MFLIISSLFAFLMKIDPRVAFGVHDLFIFMLFSSCSFVWNIGYYCFIGFSVIVLSYVIRSIRVPSPNRMSIRVQSPNRISSVFIYK